MISNRASQLWLLLVKLHTFLSSPLSTLGRPPLPAHSASSVPGCSSREPEGAGPAGEVLWPEGPQGQRRALHSAPASSCVWGTTVSPLALSPGQRPVTQPCPVPVTLHLL